MEIILLQDVKTLGKKDQVVKVSDGYARNFIIPKNLGVEKTPKALNDLKLRKAAEEKQLQEILKEARALGAKIGSGSITVTMKGGEGGRTFGSISTKEIVATAKTQLHIDIDKKKLVLEEPIRNFGTYHVPVKLHPEVTAELTVKVVEQ